jgi:hypothetical protein
MFCCPVGAVGIVLLSLILVVGALMLPSPDLKLWEQQKASLRMAAGWLAN